MKRHRVNYAPHAGLTRHVGLSLALTLSLGLVVIFLVLTGGQTLAGGPALAQDGSAIQTATLRVSSTHPNRQNTPTCGVVLTPCKTIQYAVNKANPGDEVRVAAGTYEGVSSYEGKLQVVFISKTLTLRGGYTDFNWLVPAPDLNRTTIDADLDGRVIVITGSITVTVSGFDITYGDGDGLKGCTSGIHDCGGGVYARHANVALLNNRIYRNRATNNQTGHGGGVYVQADFPATTVLISDCDIYSNTASWIGGDQGHGGGVRFDGGVAIVRASHIMSNTASYSGLGYGGGINASVQGLTLTGTLLRNNTASTNDNGYGGAVYVSEGMNTISSSQILSNTSSTKGEGRGGGVYVNDDTTFTMEDSTISGNLATNDSGDDGWGGGFFSDDDTYLTLKDNTFSSNRAATGVNSEGLGGGVYVYDPYNLTFEDNTVQGNTASLLSSGSGGALLAERANQVLLKGNDFVSNTGSANHDGTGGGIYLYRSNVTIEGNKILGNVGTTQVLSTGIGGGIYVQEQVNMTMTNNLVADNKGPHRADGMWFDGSGADESFGVLIHNTFADNGEDPSGEGIVVTSTSDVVMTDTIISGHGEYGMWLDDLTTADMEATLWWNNTADTDGAGTLTTGPINLNKDPAYADPASWDYHLTADSAALDEGIDAGVYVDLDGVPRPALEGFDIGAYEFPHGVSLTPDRVGYGQPGDLVTYTHTLTNDGIMTDTFSFSYEGDLGWGASYGDPITLAAGVTETVVFTVQVAADAISGTVETTTFTATSQGGPSAAASVADQTVALLKVGVGLAPDGAQDAAPGEVVTYTHTLTNTGNWTDTLILVVDSSQGWTMADSGAFTLAAGVTETVVVTVTVPATATDGTVDTTTVTATSSLDAMQHALVTDTTTVKLAIFKVYLPVVLKNQ